MEKKVAQVESLIHVIVGSLVDYPREVEINVLEGHTTAVFEVFVRQSDVGKVVGRKGGTIQAVRRLLDAVGSKDRKTYVLQVVED